MSTSTTPPASPIHTVVDTMRAAEYLGLHPRTLDNWRSQGRGPRYIRISGRRIVYRTRDLDEYLQMRTVEPGESQ